MIFGNCIIELKLVEKLRLFALQPSHHGLPPPRFVSARWNHGSPQASTTSATKSATSGSHERLFTLTRSPMSDDLFAQIIVMKGKARLARKVDKGDTKCHERRYE